MPIWRSEETIPRHEKTLGPDTTVAIQVHAQRLGGLIDKPLGPGGKKKKRKK
jgi:hypothetical protein